MSDDRTLYDIAETNYDKCSAFVSIFSAAADWETLELLAPKITELETRTRYDKDFSANVKIVERVFAAARQFLDWVGEQEVQRRREAERESANINAAAIKRNDRKS